MPRGYCPHKRLPWHSVRRLRQNRYIRAITIAWKSYLGVGSHICWWKMFHLHVLSIQGGRRRWGKQDCTFTIVIFCNLRDLYCGILLIMYFITAKFNILSLHPPLIPCGVHECNLGSCDIWWIQLSHCLVRLGFKQTKRWELVVYAPFFNQSWEQNS